MRYNLRLEVSGLSFAAITIILVGAIIIVQQAITGEFDIWIIPIVPLSFIIVLLIFEPMYRATNYLILHESHLDFRRTVWPGGGPLKVRITYDSIVAIDVTSEKGEVKLVFHPALSSGGYATYTHHRVFRPRDPNGVVSEIRRRAEAVDHVS